MQIRKRIYNILIQREKYPPLSHCNKISYNTCRSANSTLLHTAYARVGRVSLFLLVTFIAFTFTSCTKDDGGDNVDTLDLQYHEQPFDWNF